MNLNKREDIKREDSDSNSSDDQTTMQDISKSYSYQKIAKSDVTNARPSLQNQLITKSAPSSNRVSFDTH